MIALKWQGACSLIGKRRNQTSNKSFRDCCANYRLNFFQDMRHRESKIPCIVERCGNHFRFDYDPNSIAYILTHMTSLLTDL
ncbi:CLUMA_CG019355, isoform A [Clunio marinus]|uniref:CLUMA_CG019355, isoform A n=1 Tax=Clunio marinus TaxID=568069 RepID=A0A1J1J0G5_9DIPT|nr:CLUMA_CG019355, isoform A [Clunio marinus]